MPSWGRWSRPVVWRPAWVRQVVGGRAERCFLGGGVFRGSEAVAGAVRLVLGRELLAGEVR